MYKLIEIDNIAIAMLCGKQKPQRTTLDNAKTLNPVIRMCVCVHMWVTSTTLSLANE